MSPEIIRISRERFKEDAETALRQGMPWKRKLAPATPGFVKRAFLTALNPFFGDWRQEQRRIIAEREQLLPERAMTALKRVGQHETGAHAFNLAPATSDADDLRAAVEHVQSLVKKLRLAENPQDSFRASHRPRINKDAPFIIGTTLGLLDDAKTALQNALDENGLKHLKLEYYDGTPALQKSGAIQLWLSGDFSNVEYSRFLAKLNAVADVWGLTPIIDPKKPAGQRALLKLSLADHTWGAYK